MYMYVYKNICGFIVTFVAIDSRSWSLLTKVFDPEKEFIGFYLYNFVS